MPSELTQRAFAAGLTPDVADRIDVLMRPAKDRLVVMRLQNNIFARAVRAGDWARAERSALRRALLDPQDHRPWLDVAAAREGQGALTGALEALGRAQLLDGGGCSGGAGGARTGAPTAQLKVGRAGWFRNSRHYMQAVVPEREAACP